jgi:Tfp pilus assembly protein PilN
MYDINLIKDRVVPERRKYIMMSIAGVSGLACVITLLATVFFVWANSSTVGAYASEIDKLEDDLAALYPGTPTEQELTTMINGVKPELKKIGEIIDGRCETTRIWEAIAAAVPDSVWLTAVRVTTPDRLGRAKSKRSSTPGGWISVEGLALIDGDAGGVLIRRFAKRLEQSPELAAVITGSRFVETGRQRIGSANVLGFEITCPFE